MRTRPTPAAAAPPCLRERDNPLNSPPRTLNSPPRTLNSPSSRHLERSSRAGLTRAISRGGLEGV
eukprot:104661-Prorocentrum_minimum.AAC.1